VLTLKINAMAYSGMPMFGHQARIPQSRAAAKKIK
jgi:hypothetical protein